MNLNEVSLYFIIIVHIVVVIYLFSNNVILIYCAHHGSRKYNIIAIFPIPNESVNHLNETFRQESLLSTIYIVFLF